MASEKSILRALDLLTIAPQGKIAALSLAAHSHVTRMRRVMDTENVNGYREGSPQSARGAL